MNDTKNKTNNTLWIEEDAIGIITLFISVAYFYFLFYLGFNSMEWVPINDFLYLLWYFFETMLCTLFQRSL